jgi:hypothetical protein
MDVKGSVLFAGSALMGHSGRAGSPEARHPRGDDVQAPVATVIVRFETAMTPASFAAARTQFDQNGEASTTVSGFGDAAYSSTLGSGQYANTTLVVLKGSTGLLVTGPASLAQIQALEQQILPR